MLVEKLTAYLRPKRRKIDIDHHRAITAV